MGSGIEEQYCLRWHDFQANVTSAFSDIRDDEDLLDVTLVCPDGHMLRAHKLMLSACSPMFKAMLQRNSHPQPVIFLHGVKHVDVAAILNFMYHGEVNVTEGNISSFLAIAEDLKVRGLTQADLQDRMPPALKKATAEVAAKRRATEEEPESPKVRKQEFKPTAIKPEPNQNVVITPDLPPNGTTDTSAIKESRKHVVICESKDNKKFRNSIQLKNDNNTRGNKNCGKRHLLPSIKTFLSFLVRRHSMVDYSGEEGVSYHRLGGRDADDPMSTMMVALSHKGWHCPECLHTSTTKGNLKSHILSGRHKLFEKSHPCQYCHRSYSTRQSLQVHISTHHRFERDAEYQKGDRQQPDNASSASSSSTKTETTVATTTLAAAPQVAQIVQAYPPKTDGNTSHHQFVNYLSQQATMVGNAFATTAATPMPLNYQVSTNEMRLPHNV